MKILKILIALLVLAYAAICAFMYSQQGNLLYFPQAEDSNYSKQFVQYELEFKNGDVRLHGWGNIQNVNPQNPLHIYYGGNGDEASRNLPLMSRLDARNFLIINYRSYGRSQGHPEEQDLKQDALFIFDEVSKQYGIDSSSVILLGRSLGSGIATYVASEREVAKVVLITPYDSIVSVAKKQFPYLPVSLLMNQRFESDKLAPSIEESVLCLIAANDAVIPNQHAHNLCDVWKGKMQKFTLAGTGHNNISVHPSFVKVIKSFINLKLGSDGTTFDKNTANTPSKKTEQLDADQIEFLKIFESNDREKHLHALIKFADDLVWLPPEKRDTNFIINDPNASAVIKGFAEDSEYAYNFLGFTLMHLLYPMDDSNVTKYIVDNFVDKVGPFKSQELVAKLVGREEHSPELVREFWHKVVLKGLSEDINGPLEAALKLSELNQVDREKYLEDIIRLMETEQYLGTLSLLIAIANYGITAEPYLDRLLKVRERMALKYKAPHEQSYMQRIDTIIELLLE